MAEEQSRVSLGGFILPINPKSITIKFNKKVIQHEVPGRDGDIVQVLGTKSKEITWHGRFMKVIGSLENAETNSIRMLEQYQKTGEEGILELVLPIRISNLSTSTKVVIKDLNISDEEGRSDYLDYDITVVEWRAVEFKLNQVVLINQYDLDNLKATFRKKKAMGNV